ncbi:type IV pilus secretin PilQ [Pseudomonas sp. zfem002]|uniref:type IV pilus secretin PilQ n=1 Tax=Pseudomonas sp. zfem002 TaxID=3078197 RepID=UPI002927E8AF|nr:type IV pilus secretin PilQ [Pseudomonas sp. zfem002]MDU9389545.1 type IV pilus secretin PilQ [Pseudomonas sp. zfem002]
MNRMFMLVLCLVLLAPSVVAVPLPGGSAGKPLSLNFQDVEVRAVLQVLADFVGVNLVVSDEVRGNVTLRLQEVPWEQALDTVLRSKGLGKRMDGNVLLVAPLAELADTARPQSFFREQALLQVNHASAADLAALLQPLLEANPDEEPWGAISVDERTNTLVTSQSPQRLDTLRRLLGQLDVPVRQVLIEARVVEANVDYERGLGVRWGGSLGGGRLNARGLGVESPTFVDLGLDRPASGIGFGLIGDSGLLDLELSAMEKSGNGEIISQPKVLTADKETARILKGSEVPYQESGANGTTSITFREASLSLEVTPQIMPGGEVSMQVKVTKDEPDYLNVQGTVPPIRKNEVNARVRVGDGQTIVIGGVYSTSKSNVQDKVPFFGDVPYVGRLFRRSTIQEKKSELLVFLTPRIMSDQAIAVSH